MQTNISPEIIEAQAKLKKAEQLVDHFNNLLNGFNFLIKQKAMVINGTVVHLYPELWGLNYRLGFAWMEKCYAYLRLKELIPPGSELVFKNIETDEVIGMYKDGKGELYTQ